MFPFLPTMLKGLLPLLSVRDPTITRTVINDPMQKISKIIINLGVTISNLGETTNNNSLPNNNLYCQLCDGRGHAARVCRTSSQNHLQAHANYAAHLQNQSAAWIVDSGATHHIGSDT
ncbi:hypothetical protein KY289_001449 [Solanum tuberosum]|nr:hypothetical protein KY289_001449 [Solanum tuberosum]